MATGSDRMMAVLWYAGLINACLSLQVLQLDAPAYVHLGNQLDMNCTWDLEGKKLYSIKWFLGPTEIFSYISTPSGSGVSTFSSSTPGVSITSSLVTPSSSCQLSMSNVTLITTGYFKCMVTGGDIPFKEDYDTKHVTIAVSPSLPPEISGVPADLSPGDFLSLNCSTYNSSVSPHLLWVLNHEEVTEFGLERRYPSTITSFLGRLDIPAIYISTLGLEFWVKRKHFREGKLVVSCKASLPGIYNMSSSSHVVGRYTEPHQYLETRSSCGQHRACIQTLHILAIIIWRVAIASWWVMVARQDYSSSLNSSILSWLTWRKAKFKVTAVNIKWGLKKTWRSCSVFWCV